MLPHNRIRTDPSTIPHVHAWYAHTSNMYCKSSICARATGFMIGRERRTLTHMATSPPTRISMSTCIYTANNYIHVRRASRTWRGGGRRPRKCRGRGNKRERERELGESWKENSERRWRGSWRGSWQRSWQRSWEESWDQLPISKVTTRGREVDGPPSAWYAHQ
ncbi:hypothetical protein P167DRAFT_276025 [Morchella conica CCBAS932]|uniref:Uncharacterized protein n=1 Tax=Morchella conica CCBAS932 TaxID=1392247 RepID=A0A3N4KP50_9PEZI|nr:hypothetical protein P167DRAFT_276025 [Morchella conica CCBAS932]